MSDFPPPPGDQNGGPHNEVRRSEGLAHTGEQRAAEVDSENQYSITQLVLLVELGLLILAGLVAWLLGFYDRSQPLWPLDAIPWTEGMIWGLAGTAPMVAMLALLHYFPVGPLRSLKRLSHDFIAPLFARTSLAGLLVISLMAGLAEEIAFRWMLQGGLAEVLPEPFAVPIALLLASLLFGICHAVSRLYFAVATLIGVYLGALMLVSGTVLAPIIAHALYDFVALIYLVRQYRQRQRQVG